MTSLAAGLIAALLWWRVSADSGTAPLAFAAADLEAVVLAPDDPHAALADPRVRAAVDALGDRVMRDVAVAGRAVDPSGRPLGDAEVRLEVHGVAGMVRRLREPTVTGADGRFEFRGVAPEALWFVLELRHAVTAPVVLDGAVVAGGVDVGDVVLADGGAVSGRVTRAAGAPVEGAMVSLRPAEGNRLDRTTGWRELLPPSVTGADGAFRIDRLPPGGYRLSARAAGAQDGSAAVRVEAGRECLAGNIALEAGYRLAGTVTAPDGAAVAGAQVRLCEVPSTPPGPRVREVVLTDADGRFDVAHLPDRPLRVEVVADGFLAWRGECSAPSVGRSVAVTLAPGLVLGGVVVELETGEPVTRYAAQLRRIESLKGEDVTEPRPTDLGAPSDHPGGRFRFEGLEAGTYAVDVLSPEFAHARSELVELAAGVAPRDLLVRLARGLALAGRVLSAPDDRPVAGVRVCLKPGGTTAPQQEISLQPTVAPRAPTLASTTTDAGGTFRFECVPNGDYSIVAEREGSTSTPIAVAAYARDRLDLRVVLLPFATIHGSVSGVPAGREPDVHVIAYGGVGAVRAVPVGTAGRFELSELRPGPYLVRAFLGDARDFLVSRVRSATDARGGLVEVDVLLAPGEYRELSLSLDAPVHGALRGAVTVAGAPAPGCRVSLLPSAATADAPRWVGRLLATNTDADGSFSLRGVPSGEFILSVERGHRAIHRERVVVAAGAEERIDVSVAIGALDVRVVTRDGAPSQRLHGTVRLLIAATSLPDDLAGWQRDHLVLHEPLSDGLAAIDDVPAGPVVIVVEVAGRQRSWRAHVVRADRARSTIEVEAGASSPSGR